jgi:hypothetical protein
MTLLFDVDDDDDDDDIQPKINIMMQTKWRS